MFEVVDKVSYFRLQAKIWFAFVILVGVVWLVLWFKSDNEIHRSALRQQQQEQMVRLPTKIDHLTELFKEVAPVKFETITRDLRSYPPEFKDKKYFEDNAKKWAVQVMDVGEHKVIVDYLDTRPDRDKFAYFRYLDQNKQSRYLLTYGTLSSFQEAMGATKMVDFRLPNNVRVVPEEIRRYLDMIDGYERSTVTESKTEIKEIQLKPTHYEVPVAPRQPTTSLAPKKSVKKPTDADVVSLEDDQAVAKPKKPKKSKATELEAFNQDKRRAQAEAAARAKANESKNELPPNAVPIGD